jgi:hypothetical protein
MAQTDGKQRTTHIAVEALAICPFSMAEAYATEYLRAAEEHGIEAGMGLSGRFPLSLVRHRVALAFGIHSDLHEQGRRHDELRIHWTSGMRILPDFHGSIRFRIEANRTRVRVEGSFEPPMGLAGRLFDVTIGNMIARSSMQDLADRIAAYLTLRERQWRAEQTAALS